MQQDHTLPPHTLRNLTNEELTRHLQFSDEPMVSALVQRLEAEPDQDEIDSLENQIDHLSQEVDSLSAQLDDYEGYDEDLTALDDIYPPPETVTGPQHPGCLAQAGHRGGLRCHPQTQARAG